MGHLRYGTFGKNSIDFVHPVMRQNNWKSRNLVLAGNFNLTNVDELFDHLTLKGQHPRDKGDTFIMLESLGFELDQEVQKEYNKIKQRYSNDITITSKNISGN